MKGTAHFRRSLAIGLALFTLPFAPPAHAQTIAFVNEINIHKAFFHKLIVALPNAEPELEHTVPTGSWKLVLTDFVVHQGGVVPRAVLELYTSTDGCATFEHMITVTVPPAATVPINLTTGIEVQPDEAICSRVGGDSVDVHLTMTGYMAPTYNGP